MRDLIELFEAAIDFERGPDKVVANLTGHDSMVYTKLAKKVKRIEELEEEIKNLRKEVRTDTKQYVADLFTVEDETRTRVINTLSFIFTLSKNPKPTVTVQYAKVLTELEQHLTPELIAVLSDLKEKYSSVVQKEPSLKIEPVESVNESSWDSLTGYWAKYLGFIKAWSRNYDKKLATLKQMVQTTA